MRVAVAAVGFLALTSSAHALEWRLGLAYASGLSDVTDLYEDNLDRSGLDADVDLKFPIGITVGAKYDWASGMRADLGLGPAFFIEGDVDHFELPVTATVGYDFNRSGELAPYIRGGLAYHIASGDFYESSAPGLFVAAGIDFSRFTIELGADLSKVKLETVECDTAGPCESDTRKVSTFDFILSGFWRFY
jgi:hypothetical protein